MQAWRPIMPSHSNNLCSQFFQQKNQNKGKQDMIEMARKWNIKILTPNQLMAEFKRLKLHPLPSEGHKKSGMQYKGYWECPLN